MSFHCYNYFLTGPQTEEPDNAPDLVISGTNVHQSLTGLITPSFEADTVVLSRDPAAHAAIESQGWMGKILEKPETKQENLRMLLELNGQSCEVVTGVSVRAFAYPNRMTRTLALRNCISSVSNYFRPWIQDQVRSFVCAFYSGEYGYGPDMALTTCLQIN